MITEVPYQSINTSVEAGEIVSSVFHSKGPVILIPPRFSETEVSVTDAPNPDDDQVALFSSGSTGTPKCLWNAKDRLIKNAEISADAFQVSGKDRLLILASPWHVAGLSWALMAQKSGIPYHMETPHVRNASQWVDLITDYKPTMLLTVPGALRHLTQHKGWFVDTIAYGGASLQPNDYDTLVPHTKEVIQAYGQTEAGGLIALYRKKLSQIKPETDFNNVGIPPAAFTITTNGTREKPAAVFLNSPASVHNSTYDTGDLGFIDAEGNLHLTGRVDDSSGDCNMITAVTSVAHK